MPQATGFAQSYTIRPTCNPNGQCKANTANFGFNDTNWRQWPVQPRPEQRDSETIGGTVIPTPPPIPEQPLPHAESLPAKPPISGGTREDRSCRPRLDARSNAAAPVRRGPKAAPAPAPRQAPRTIRIAGSRGTAGHSRVSSSPRTGIVTPKAEGGGIEPLDSAQGSTPAGGNQQP